MQWQTRHACSVTRMAPSASLRNDSGWSPIVLQILWKTRVKGRKHLVTSRKDKLLCVYCRSFVKLFVLRQDANSQIQTNLTLRKLWRGQNPVEDFSNQKFSFTNEAISRCDLPLRPVASILQQPAATCRPTRTKGVIYHRNVVQRHIAWCVPSLKEAISHKHNHKKRTHR